MTVDLAALGAYDNYAPYSVGSGIDPSTINWGYSSQSGNWQSYTPPASGGGSGSGGSGLSSGGGGPVSIPDAAFSAQQMLENVLFAATGVSGLGGWAAGLYNRGASATEIVQALRYGTDTSDGGKQAHQAYLNEFPGMDKFLKDGTFSGNAPEMQYIEYRNTVKEAARRFGVGDYLVSKEKIASYIEGRNSAAEIVSRMTMAASAAGTTPPETMAVLRDTYGVREGDLVSFFLNPDETEAELNKRYTAARIGAEAARQKFGVSRDEMETLAERGISDDQARGGFGLAYDRMALTVGKGDTVSRDQVFESAFGDAAAEQAALRAIAAQRNRFEAGGGFVGGQGGVTGIGSASS